MPVVSSELGIGPFEGRVAVGFRFFDTINVMRALVNRAMIRECSTAKFIESTGGRTRCGEPFCSGYAETSSLILYATHVRT